MERKRAVEVGHGLSLPMPPAGFDLMHQHVAAPSMLNGRLGVPDAILGGGELFEDCEVVVPGNLCKHRLHKCLIRPRLGERPHIFQVARRESLHIGEGSLEVRRQAVDHFGAPAFPFLPVEDIAADLPVQQDQFPVDRQRCMELRSLNPALQVGQKLCVAVGSEWFRHGRGFPSIVVHYGRPCPAVLCAGGADHRVSCHLLPRLGNATAIEKKPASLRRGNPA